MKLKKISCELFRSIGNKVELPLDERVTILLGSNDHGKSNLLHAIRLLNKDVPFVADDENWMLEDKDPRTHGRAMSLSYVFKLTEEEVSSIEGIISTAIKSDAAAGSAIEDDFANFRKGELIINRNKEKERIILGLVRGSSLAEKLAAYIEECIPRVELFSVENQGNLQDSATSAEIMTPPFESLQGVFYMAGLDPSDGTIFKQTPKTEKQLVEASGRLNEEIAHRWTQGNDLGLEFQLVHHDGKIKLRLTDPAVESRFVPLSKRSTGVTQFFKLQMMLFSRQQKIGAKSYIYLYDEPGIYLHPKGQRDLVRVLEKLSAKAQIVYSTHSVFMINHNYPGRHRLIFKDEDGTKIENKAAKANWRDSISHLGITLPPSALFCDRVLLVEGDSDIIYLYELFTKLINSGKIRCDINKLGMVSFGKLSELLHSIRHYYAPGSSVHSLGVLVDGDKAGADYIRAVNDRSKKSDRKPSLSKLDEEMSIEDYCLFPDKLVESFRGLASELGDKLSLAEGQMDSICSRLGGAETKNRGQIIDEAGVSKTTVARIYSDLCRELPLESIAQAALQRAIKLCMKLSEDLKLQPEESDNIIEQ